MNFKEKLIGEVRKNEILYKKTSVGYKNISAIFGNWNEISYKLNSTDDIFFIS